MINILLWSMCTAFANNTQMVDSIAALINDDVITHNELNERVKSIRRDIKLQQATMPEDTVLQSQVLKQMITEKVLLQVATQQDIHVTDKQLKAAENRIAEQNHITVAKLKNNLRNNGITYKAFKADLEKQLIIATLQRRQFMDKVSVSDAEINHHLQTHPITQNTQYHIGHILIPLSENPTSQALQAANRKAATIKTALEQKAFHQFVQDNQDSEVETIDLGYRHPSALPILLARQVQHMKINEVSSPIRDASGLHVMMLLDSKSDKSQPVNMAALREKIRNQLFEQKLGQAVALWVNQLKSSAHIEIIDKAVT